MRLKRENKLFPGGAHRGTPVRVSVDGSFPGAGNEKIRDSKCADASKKSGFLVEALARFAAALARGHASHRPSLSTRFPGSGQWRNVMKTIPRSTATVLILVFGLIVFDALTNGAAAFCVYNKSSAPVHANRIRTTKENLKLLPIFIPSPTMPIQVFGYLLKNMKTFRHFKETIEPGKSKCCHYTDCYSELEYSHRMPLDFRKGVKKKLQRVTPYPMSVEGLMVPRNYRISPDLRKTLVSDAKKSGYVIKKRDLGKLFAAPAASRVFNPAASCWINGGGWINVYNDRIECHSADKEGKNAGQCEAAFQYDLKKHKKKFGRAREIRNWLGRSRAYFKALGNLKAGKGNAACGPPKGVFTDLFNKATNTLRFSGVLHLQSKYSGKCIDKSKARKANADVYMWTCSKKNKNQMFMPGAQPGDGGYFRLRDPVYDLCPGIKGASKGINAKIVQQGCRSGDHVVWKRVEHGFGWFQLKSKHSSWCLNHHAEKRNEARLTVQRCRGKYDGYLDMQLFRLYYRKDQ
jgi:hypothetical protein